MELGTLILLVLDAALIGLFIVKGSQRARPWRELQAAYDAYRDALDLLAAHPRSPAHRRRAEELGGAYIALLRRRQADAVMDERVLRLHIATAARAQLDGAPNGSFEPGAAEQGVVCSRG